MKPKVLLINCPSSIEVYSKSKIKTAIGIIPFVSLAALAAVLLKNKCEVKVLDLMLSKEPKKDLISKLKEFSPTYVGITFTTPLYKEAKELAAIVKSFSSKIKIIGGGVHPTILPKEVLANTEVDIVVVGEGDYVLPEVIFSEDLSKVKGIAYKKNGKIVMNERADFVKNLNALPYPAWHLFDVQKYRKPRTTTRENPIGTIETSRGCVYRCYYCNKSIFSRQFRFKSPKRVVDEIEHLLRVGFKDIHVIDDNFTTNRKRAKEICDEIIKRNLKFPWNLDVGVRVDCVDFEMLKKIKRAGCYGISFGFESGNQKILNELQKDTTIDQAYEACEMAKKAGLEVTGFFMFGSPSETEGTMKETIEFAKKLDCDYAKVTLIVPFPSTAMFEDLDKRGLIRTKDWSSYNFHTSSKVFTHPSLSWDVLERYYNRFYSEYYFRPKFIFRRLKKGLLNGNVFFDAYYFVKTWFF